MKPRWILFFFNLLVVFSIVFGIIPREYALLNAIIIAGGLLLLPLQEAFLLFVSAIPFWIALPLTPTFDSLSSGRVFMLLLTIRWLFVLPHWKPSVLIAHVKQNREEAYGIVFFLMSYLSLWVASDSIAGMEKILFLLNLAAIYPIASWLIRSKAVEFVEIRYALLVSTIFVIAIGWGQLLMAYLLRVSEFWPTWASMFSYNFYGLEFWNIVMNANVWFAYHADNVVTIRMFSTFSDAHAFGLYILVALVSVIAYLLNKSSARARFFWWIFLLVGFCSIIFTQTRGLYLSYVLTLGIALALSYRVRILQREHIFQLARMNVKIFLIFLIVFPFMSFFLSFPQFREETTSEDRYILFKRLTSIFDTEETSNQGRTGIWKASMESIIKHPLLGVGAGNFPVILKQNTKLAKAGSSAHSAYLNVVAESGVIAGIGFIGFFFVILQQAWRKFWHHASALNLAIFMITIWLLFYSIFDIAMFDERIMYLLLTTLALRHYEE